jgi:hypothetical protein
MVAREQRLQAQLIRCQYLYFCTGKAGTFVLASKYAMVAREQRLRAQLLTCQYLYFCTSKASKLGTSSFSRVSICTFVLVKQVNRGIYSSARAAAGDAADQVSVFVLLY